ncbi:MAG: hypothetical protein KDJ29_19015, partial [Hyphomicrobiales bacterium]|nr:hypothetical protein [Hyphomicrobiales bacterium]
PIPLAIQQFEAFGSAFVNLLLDDLLTLLQRLAIRFEAGGKRSRKGLNTGDISAFHTPSEGYGPNVGLPVRNGPQTRIGT